MLYIALHKCGEKIKSRNGNRWKLMFICIMSLIVALFIMGYMNTTIHDMKASSYFELCYHPQLVHFSLMESCCILDKGRIEGCKRKMKHLK
jgi:hypothetical protein